MLNITDKGGRGSPGPPDMAEIICEQSLICSVVVVSYCVMTQCVQYRILAINKSHKNNVVETATRKVILLGKI